MNHQRKVSMYFFFSKSSRLSLDTPHRHRKVKASNRHVWWIPCQPQPWTRAHWPRHRTRLLWQHAGQASWSSAPLFMSLVSSNDTLDKLATRWHSYYMCHLSSPWRKALAKHATEWRPWKPFVFHIPSKSNQLLDDTISDLIGDNTSCKGIACNLCKERCRWGMIPPGEVWMYIAHRQYKVISQSPFNESRDAVNVSKVNYTSSITQIQQTMQNASNCRWATLWFSFLKALALTSIAGTVTIIHEFLLIELESAVCARIEQPSGQYTVLPFNTWALWSENIVQHRAWWSRQQTGSVCIIFYCIECRRHS